MNQNLIFYVLLDTSKYTNNNNSLIVDMSSFKGIKIVKTVSIFIFLSQFHYRLLKTRFLHLFGITKHKFSEKISLHIFVLLFKNLFLKLKAQTTLSKPLHNLFCSRYVHNMLQTALDTLLY